MCNIWLYNSIPMSVLWGRLPTGQWETPITSIQPLRNRQLCTVIRCNKHWKQCLGAPMFYFRTNNPLLIYALCAILTTSHWGTPHYSQLATEEWLHLTAIWGTWNTLNIESHLGGPWCVISGPIIVSWYKHYVWYSKPASEECQITPKRPLGSGQLHGVRSHIKHWKQCLRAPMCYSGQIVLSWYMHYVWYSKPATGEHPITPNWPLRNGCIWQQYEARETH